MRGLIFGFSLGLLLVCCVRGSAFPTTFVPKARPTPAQVLKSLQKVPLRDERPVAAGIIQGSSELFVWDMQSKKLLWKRSIQARSSPRVAGAVVVTREAEGVVARKLDTGEVLLDIDEDVNLVGADGVGDFLVLALAAKGKAEPAAMLVAARGDRIVWWDELDLPVGVPAAAGGYVVLPWATNRLSFVNADDGEEELRLQMRDSVAGHAFVDRGFVYVGQHGIFRVSPSLEAGSKDKAIYYSPFARSMPGQPGLLRESYEPIPPPEHAGNRVNLSWRVGGEGESIKLEDNNLYLQFYRLVFALNAESDSIRWVYQAPSDVVGSAAQPGGLFLADEAGKILFLTADGRAVWEAQIGVRPAVAHIRPGSLIPSGQPAGGLPSAKGGSATEPQALPPLQDQLLAAAKLDDPRLASGRAFAIERLARFDDAIVTGWLLEICDDSSAPDLVRNSACDKLPERASGADYVLKALERHASFLKGTNAPPVGALARAAQAMRLRTAGSLLIAHLEDPETPAQDLAPALEALEALGARAAAAPIERFLRLHHAEPEEPGLTAALQAAVKALASLSGKAAEPSLRGLAQDPMSGEKVRAFAQQALAGLNAPPPGPAPKRAAPPPSSEKPSPPPAPPPEPEIKKPYLTMDIVAEVMRPVEFKLRRCFIQDQGKSLSVRIAMVVNGDGRIEKTFVTPATMQECVEKTLADHGFPRTRAGHQQVVYEIQRIQKRAEATERPGTLKRKPGRPGKPGPRPAGSTAAKPADKPPAD